jgi:hypothetical protein
MGLEPDAAPFDGLRFVGHSSPRAERTSGRLLNFIGVKSSTHDLTTGGAPSSPLGRVESGTRPPVPHRTLLWGKDEMVWGELAGTRLRAGG